MKNRTAIALLTCIAVLLCANLIVVAAGTSWAQDRDAAQRSARCVGITTVGDSVVLAFEDGSISRRDVPAVNTGLLNSNGQHAAEAPPIRIAPPPRPELAAQLLEALVGPADEDLAIQLVEQGAPVEHEYDRGVVTLHYAARATMPRLTRLLLEYGADANVRMDNGQTPMHWAARAGGSNRPNSRETIEVLLEFGGDINAVSDGGTRPIDFAFQLGNEEWAEYLVSKGALR